MKYITLPNTDIRVSRMAIGTGTHGWAGRSNQTDLGMDKLCGLFCAGLERGVTFWDSADQYGSHPFLANALKQTTRDKVVILSKTTALSQQNAAADVDRFLHELGTDMVDIVLLHGLRAADWPETHPGAMEALAKAKEAGKVRAVGFSCHGLGAMRTAVKNDWVDVVLARINYAGSNMDGKVSEVVPLLADLQAAGKAVLAMKVLGCGELVADVRKAIGYVLGLGTVSAMTLGMTSLAQLEENVRLVDELG